MFGKNKERSPSSMFELGYAVEAKRNVGRQLLTGVARAQNAFKNIRAEKEALRQQRETYDIQKKKANLELEQLKYNVSPEVLDYKKKKLKLGQKTAEAKLETAELALGEQEYKHKTNLEVQASLFQKFQEDPNAFFGGGGSYDAQGGFSRSAPRGKDAKDKRFEIAENLSKGEYGQVRGDEYARHLAAMGLTPEAIAQEYSQQPQNQEQQGEKGGAEFDPNKLPEWVDPNQREAYRAAIKAGYTEEEVKQYLGVA